MQTQYQPTQNYIIIKPDGLKEKTASGIFIPESYAKKIHEGEVLATGPEVNHIKVGQRVVFLEHSEVSLKEDGEIINVVAESNIILCKDAKTLGE